MTNDPWKKPGSAMLIALLIVTLTSAIGFGLTRIGLMQARLQNASSSLGQAYQTAEAGLELGLAQYRLDPGGEVSFQRSVQGTTDPVISTSSPMRYSLNGDPLVEGGQPVTGNNQFDLLMYHHALSIGDDSCFSTSDLASCDNVDNPIGTLKPGETYTLTIPNPSNQDLKVFLRAQQPDCSANGPAALVVNGYNSPSGDSSTFIKQQFINFCDGSATNYTTGSGDERYKLDLGLTYTKKVSLTYYASSGQLDFALRVNDSNPDINSGRLPFDSGVTTIDVTGYAGGTSRRLRASIDRRTNKLLGVFSYAVYGESFAPAP